MALIKINKLERMDKIRNTVHKEVHGTYTVFACGDKKYFQIDKYGSDDRKTTDKVSQSIQFDKEAARYLVNLLIREFGIAEYSKE